MRLARFTLGLLLISSCSSYAADEQAPDPVLRELCAKRPALPTVFPDRFDAAVWLTDMSRRLAPKVRDPEERIRILKRVHYEATRANLPPELVLAVIDIESNFDRYAISVAGAQGLMQVMPFWLEEIGRPNDNLMHIDTNLRFGCTILRYYMDIENDDLVRALGRYNGSLGKRKYPNKVIDRLRLKWFRS